MAGIDRPWLSDCVSSDAAKCTLLLVQEGRLLEAALRHRDRLTEAVLPTDPSVGRAAGLDLAAALDDDFVQALAAALGTGVSHGDVGAFDLQRLRYHSIVIQVENTECGRETEERTIEVLKTLFGPIIEAGHVRSIRID